MVGCGKRSPKRRDVPQAGIGVLGESHDEVHGHGPPAFIFTRDATRCTVSILPLPRTGKQQS
jgi:hypothetical protein